MSERKNSLGTDIPPRLFEATNMLADRPKTKILVDGGDPEETREVKTLLGFVDGQTTNPSLIAKNPAIRQQIASGHRLSSRDESEAYKKIVQTLSPMVGDAGVSIEVFADLNTSAERMLAKAKRCSGGFRTPTSNTPARTKACGLRNYRCARTSE